LWDTYKRIYIAILITIPYQSFPEGFGSWAGPSQYLTPAQISLILVGYARAKETSAAITPCPSPSFSFLTIAGEIRRQPGGSECFWLQSQPFTSSFTFTGTSMDDCERSGVGE